MGGEVAKWLARLGFQKDDNINLILLPTKKGKLAGWAVARTLHRGKNVAEYNKQVLDALERIMEESVRKGLNEKEQVKRILDYLKELQVGLTHNKIKLHKYDIVKGKKSSTPSRLRSR